MTPGGPRLRYEARAKGLPFDPPMEIIEVDSEEEAIEWARARLYQGHVTRDYTGRIAVEFHKIRRIELRLLA